MLVISANTRPISLFCFQREEGTQITLYERNPLKFCLLNFYDKILIIKFVNEFIHTDKLMYVAGLVNCTPPDTPASMNQHPLTNGSVEPVNFIVGDEGDSLENGSESNHTEEEKRENTDAFPSDNTTRNSSYKDLFGLAERRKRLR